MSCLGPLTGYWSKTVNPSGKRSLVFRKEDSLSGVPVQVPCGQCINCRIQRTANWAARLVHESKSHEVNTFVTLTYDDKNLPSDGSLNHRDFQLFMKRLREKSDFKFKFYMCGEYGGRTARPHYHAILFGCDFPDRRYYKTNSNGDRLDVSQSLEETWELGLCTVGDVTYQSASYVAGYVQQKIVGLAKDDYYMGRKPEYGLGSNGLGKDYVRKYGNKLLELDNIIIDGRKVRVPRYYDFLNEMVDPARLAVVKRERRRKALSHKEDLSNRRSWTREQVALRRLKERSRDYDP